MNKESGIEVTTMFLGQFAKDVVDAKVLEGQCKGNSGWDFPNSDTEQELRTRLQRNMWNEDWASVMVYATMLQARKYNGVKEDPEEEA